MPRRFRGSVERLGARAGVVLPFPPEEAWGVRERYHLAGTVGGCPWRGALAQEGGRCFVPLGPAWRREHGVEAGREVDVELAPEGPQAGALADDVRAALAAAPAARAFFDGLPTFYRRNFLRWIDGAKRPATRAARIAETVALLREGRRERGGPAAGARGLS
jgi:hypothetical protein